MVETEGAPTITDEQWAAAQDAFDEQLNSIIGGKSMPDDKYELVVNILDKWDEMSNSERRAMSGNAHYWKNKYSIFRTCSDDEGQLVEAATAKIVVKQSQLFEAIKEVHIHSVCTHADRL